MSIEFPPRREAVLVSWAQQFGAKISADPAGFGLTAEQSAAFELAHQAFASAYQVAGDPATRSPMNIALKRSAKKSLISQIRLLAGIVQRHPGTTNPMRIDLGLPTRGNPPSPIPAPAAAPKVMILSAAGCTARLRLIDLNNPAQRGKPAGVAGAALFGYIGDSAPAELSDWTFIANTGRMHTQVTFPPDTPPGARIWLTAFWFNPRKQPGPPAQPVCFNLPGGAIAMAA